MSGWEGARISISSLLVGQTYEQLRSCGQGRRECQAFWIAGTQTPNQILRLAHPAHASTAASVDVDMAWLTRFFFELADRNECIRAQVHSHPGAAFHSGTDDRWPVIRQHGFLSLVLPDFAAGKPDLRGAFLTEQDHQGEWRATNAHERIVIDAG